MSPSPRFTGNKRPSSQRFCHHVTEALPPRHHHVPRGTRQPALSVQRPTDASAGPRQRVPEPCATLQGSRRRMGPTTAKKVLAPLLMSYFLVVYLDYSSQASCCASQVIRLLTPASKTCISE